MNNLSCNCSERFYIPSHADPDSSPIATGKGVHDCDYIAKRNALISLAEREASAYGADRESYQWSHAFHRAMNGLAKEYLK